MPIKKITKGVLYAQNGEGAAVSMALTKTASVVWEGETLTNRQYLAASHGPWNMKTGYAPVIKVTGIVSGCVVTPHASADKVQSSAGVAYVNGTTVTVSADTDISLVRPANAKVCVSAITVNAAGAVTATKGTDGDTYDLTGGYGGAGQKPLCPVTDTVLAYVCTSEDEAAVVASGDIYLGDSANVSYVIDPIRGGIVLLEALPLNQTGNISRTVYATFYDLFNSLVAVGTVEDASLVINKDAPVETPSHDSVWKKYSAMPTIGWSLDVKKWRQDQYWADKMLDPFQDEFYLKLTETTGDAYSWYGFGILHGDYSVNMKRGPVSESLKFQGNGEIRRV